MKCMILFITWLAVFVTSTAIAQNTNVRLEATTRLEKLRSQLREVKAKETDFKEQVRKLEVELEPENLQRAFAQTPSLNPAELREKRRLQLEGEKVKAQEQLSSLADSRINLESMITVAEGELLRIKEPNEAGLAPTVKAQNAAEVAIPAVNDTDTVKPPPAKKKKKARSVRRSAPPS